MSDIYIGDKVFCCNGCKLVYELLSAKDLCAYYALSQKPGISPQEAGISTKYEYLDDPQVILQLRDFSDGKISKVTFKTPSMHCSSCIWLLENLYKVNSGIISSQVNFLRKEVSITYQEGKVTLRAVVELLVSIGYEPEINLASLQQKIYSESNKDLYIKIGIAGFAFGNIMLFSLPDYLAVDGTLSSDFKKFFGYLNILLALPVFFYSSMDYLKSAMNGLKQKSINMDVPISLGIITLFMRSLYDILSSTGSGFMDSFAGLVFFLLIGKLFQKKTYESLSFERDYRSYFPVSVMRIHEVREKAVSIEDLAINDRIIIRNQELVPADAVLIKGKGMIDYSFVTGESEPVEKNSGDMLYAGGKQIGSAIELEIIKDVSQSYLTQLWNNETFSKSSESRMTSLANKISKYFTLIVIAIASLSAIYWLLTDIYLALNAFTAVLIVACPCALALSTPFTLGNTLRIFGRNNFYLKNASVVERLAKIDTIVFDKTGTLTQSWDTKIQFVSTAADGMKLTAQEKNQIKSLVRHSTHPLSQYIFMELEGSGDLSLQHFREFPGEGITGTVDGDKIKIGSQNFIAHKVQPEALPFTRVHVSIANKYKGYFKIVNTYRKDLGKVIESLQKQYDLALLSGDNISEKKNLGKYFKYENKLHFNQTPFDKLNYIKHLKDSGKQVVMIGDGLNDAGALKQSDVGISISEDINAFSPASDGILDAKKFGRLPDFFAFSKKSVKVIIISFIISFLYNIIGLSIAAQGTLSPLIAAILMPISSVSVIIFTSGVTSGIARRMGLL